MNTKTKKKIYTRGGNNKTMKGGLFGLKKRIKKIMGKSKSANITNIKNSYKKNTTKKNPYKLSKNNNIQYELKKSNFYQENINFINKLKEFMKEYENKALLHDNEIYQNNPGLQTEDRAKFIDEYMNNLENESANTSKQILKLFKNISNIYKTNEIINLYKLNKTKMEQNVDKLINYINNLIKLWDKIFEDLKKSKTNKKISVNKIKFIRNFDNISNFGNNNKDLKNSNTKTNKKESVNDKKKLIIKFNNKLKKYNVITSNS